MIMVDDNLNQAKGPEHLRFEQLIRDEKSSIFHKYRSLTVGESSLSHFLLYEFITTFFGIIPGASGLVLRKLLYPYLLGKCGKGVIFGWSLTLRQPKRIEVGKKTVIDDTVVLSARGYGNERITVGQGVLLGRGAHVRVRNGTIEIGNRSRIGPFSFVGTTQHIGIGEDVTTGPLCSIGLLTKDDSDANLANTQRGTIQKGGVILGNGVALGGNVVILDGVEIGRGSVIGAGSVVTKDIPDESVAFGVPARVVRKRNGDDLDLASKNVM
jgi:acetyltransferase-like isoleucine patch superfamily enzyme